MFHINWLDTEIAGYVGNVMQIFFVLKGGDTQEIFDRLRVYKDF